VSEYDDPWNVPEWDPDFEPWADGEHWQTKEGEVVFLKDMTTPHLTNAIAMMRKKLWCTPKEWEVMFKAADEKWVTHRPSLLLFRLERELSSRPKGFNLFDKRKRL
jgi:hypothetical protein